MDEKNFILEFIKVYHGLPALWQVKSKLYSNRDEKNAQYDILLQKYKEKYPNAEKKDVTQKINILRTSYRKELKRIEKLEKSGAGAEEGCEPHLYYFDAMDFLRDNVQPCASQTSLMGENERVEYEPKLKKKKNNSSTDELVRLVTNRLKSLEDSCHHLGIAWSNKLSKMDRNQRIIAEKIITEVMFNGELGLLNFNTALTNISPVGNLNPSSSKVKKNNTVINSSASSLESTPTSNYPTDIDLQKYPTDILSYSSPSTPLVNAEAITDHENDHSEQNFVVEEYDPLDNLIKVED